MFELRFPYGNSDFPRLTSKRALPQYQPFKKWRSNQVFSYSQTAEKINIYCSSSYLQRQLDIPLPLRAGRSKNHTSGLLNKRAAVWAELQCQSSTSPFPSHPFLQVPSCKVKMQQMFKGQTLVQVCQGGRVWSLTCNMGLFSLVSKAAWQAVSRMSPQK